MATAASREKRYVVRAGIFVAGGLLLAALVIVLIGKERRLFDRQVTYHAEFDNVDGVNLESPVRLGGLDVGRVTSITFTPDLGNKRISVGLEVSNKFAARVRKDSVARVTSRGVLGDKAIDISLGSPESPVIPNGAEIETGASGDLSSLLKASGEIIDNSVAITRDLRLAVAAYTDPELRKDVAQLIRSAREVLGEVQHGSGPMHALVYDKKTAEDLKSFLASASVSASRIENAAAEVELVLKEVQTGNGTAHALIYDKQGAVALSELGDAATELATLVHDAKSSKNGAVHQLIYGDAQGIFADLGSAASDLKSVTDRVNRGEGSLGALIKDPTVYEDLKTVLGNVKRNRVLRALVRYQLANGEELDATGKPPASAKADK